MPGRSAHQAQRRADALGVLATGATALSCTCDSADCPARAEGGAAPGQIVIHLIAEEATVTAGGDTPGYLPGFGTVPAETVRDLAARAKLRPVLCGKEMGAEPHYRPSRALADFIRCRDVTCRFPGCGRPAEYADIDHTVPYLKLLCRVHWVHKRSRHAN